MQNIVKTKDIREDDKSKIYESIRNMTFGISAIFLILLGDTKKSSLYLNSEITQLEH